MRSYNWRSAGLPYFLLLVLTFADRAGAQEVTFENVLSSALRENPASAEIAAQYLKARSEAQLFGQISNPEIGFEVRPFVSSHDNRETEYEVSIGQSLTLGSFGARQELAKMIVEKATLSQEIAYFELLQNTKLLYAKAWILQERRGQIEGSVGLARSLLTSIRRLIQGGVVPPSMDPLFSSETARLAAEGLGVDADRARTLALLSRKTGMDLKGKRLGVLSQADLAHDNLKSSLPSAARLIERAKLGARVALAQSELARRDAFPRLAPHIGFEHTTDGDDRLNVGVQIEIPLFHRNEGAQLSAEADTHFEHAQIKYFESEAFRAELALLQESANASHEQSELYSDKVIPELNRSIELARKEVGAGQGNSSQLLQMFLSLDQAQERYLEVWTKALSERTELSILLGEDL